jgi:hypothetical protein
MINNKILLNKFKEINSNQKENISVRYSNAMLILNNYIIDSKISNLYRITNQKNSAQKHSGFTRYSIQKGFKQGPHIQYSTCTQGIAIAN